MGIALADGEGEPLNLRPIAAALRPIAFSAVALSAVALSAIGAAIALPASPAGAQPKDRCIRAAPLAPGRLLAQSAPGPIVLDGGARRVRLPPACPDETRPLGLTDAVQGAPPRRRFLLVIEDLRARAQPGVLFELKLGAAEGRPAGSDQGGARLGTLNFYAAQKPGAAARPRIVSYDVTAALRALAAGGGLDRGLILTIIPARAPAPGSQAAIGRIALVQQ
jgi:hypothetical protein